MQNKYQTVVKDLVLVGGGHSHVAVLKRFGMRPVPGLRLTLIARDVHTPYSGMLPGFIAGHYDYDDCHIDLGALARFAGARLFHDEVEGLDLDKRRVLCKNRPPVRFDLLSLNIGSQPNTLESPGAAQLALPVKPIDRFLGRWEELVRRILNGADPVQLAVVGGGAGGVELALATQHRLREALVASGRPVEDIQHTLITDTPHILPGHNSRVRSKFERILGERNIPVHTDRLVTEVRPDRLVFEDGGSVTADATLWVTQASVPRWLAESGLATDARGFVQVNERLQSISHQLVFAAGDVATVVGHPRPKSGVFAVRQGPPLADNLRRAALGRKLKPFRPQRHFLGLISTGDRYAVASRADWSVEGAWVWRAKDWIDRRFMDKYNRLPAMAEKAAPAVASGLADDAALREISAIAMRCGGCGAKVGSTVLSRVMARLETVPREDVLLGLDAPDDAAVLAVPAGRHLVQTVDYFRAFLDDPYVFGRIAANHALGDVYAMGAEPQAAMAIATVPYGREEVVEDTLYELLCGALEVLGDAGASLVGGHSSEGQELAFGLAVNGLANLRTLWRKSGMQPGERLVLSKPLGTGTLFAADMRHQAKGRWVQAAIDSMSLSTRAAAQCLQRHGASACTDVTGFGLLGHLVEMTRASAVDVSIDLDALPVLEGARETTRAGVFSSLQPQNVRLRRAIHDLEAAADHVMYPLLFDPQTSGGLLASMPAQRAAACVRELNDLGYERAAIIGQVEPQREALEPVRLIWDRNG